MYIHINFKINFNCHTFFLQPLIGSVQYMCKFGSRESVTMGERLNSFAVKCNEKVSRFTSNVAPLLYNVYRYHCLLVSVVERI